ncbi:MAG: surface lipoprotein assembly modifier [Candidatus Sedimenticola sp. (ex Thyasira tokunagai)]
MDTILLRLHLRLPILLSVFLCCLFSTHVAAGQPAVSEGSRLLNAGEPEQAYDLLWDAVMSDPDNIKANYLLGRAAMALKLYENAVAAYERILTADPNQLQARLNLGIANYALGSYTAAKYELELLLSVDPPQGIRHKAQRYLERIEGRKGESRLRARLSVGLVYNTNVGTTATAQDDWGAMVSLGLKHDWDAGSRGGFLWGTTGVLHNVFHQDVSAYDLNYLSLETGPGYLQAREYHLMFPLAYDTTRYDSNEYSSSYGIKPRVTFFHSPNLTTQLSAAWQYQNFSDQDARDGSYAGLSVMPRIFWGNERYMLQWRVGYEWKNARDNINAYSGLATRLLLRVGAERSMQGRFSLEYRHPVYDEINPSDSEVRKDDYFKAAAKFYLPAPWRDTRTVVGFDYKRNNSNISTFDYSRKRLMVNFEKEF